MKFLVWAFGVNVDKKYVSIVPLIVLWRTILLPYLFCYYLRHKEEIQGKCLGGT